jgi:two-component system sensor histidine kinase/response regulator
MNEKNNRRVSMNDNPQVNILVVDDTPANLHLLVGILAEQGYKVRAAPNGPHALKTAQANPPDLILLDIKMPSMNGYEVCKQLKTGERTRDIPVIFISALNEVVEKVKGFEAGGVDYITKPFQAEEVLARVETHLALKRMRKELEEKNAELHRLNTELARASRHKDEFLANMSHELRNPLNVILGMSEALQDGVYGELNDRMLNSVHRIEESGHHLLQLITDILDLSKIGAGKLELVIEPVSVKSVCETSLMFIKQSAHKKRIKLVSTGDQNIANFHADELRLKQVLVNLLTNAVKFTPERGTVGLEVEGNPEQQRISFTVWDTGIGITEEDMERLFQPFEQLESTSSRHHEGTGLGLALVSRLVRLHGGSVAVESEVGKGSRFIVSLPWEESGGREMGRKGDGEMGSLGDKELESTLPHHPITPSPHHPITPSPHLPNLRPFSSLRIMKRIFRH